MCGICGIVSFESNVSEKEEHLKRMNSSLTHRGPDDEGYYLDDHAAFAMRRLSIIDLQTGHQPIANEDGSICVVCNGEIYNYRELRSILEKKGHAFKTLTDTEVVIHAYEEYGVGCVRHFNGIFAIALWDALRQRLFLARDRLGIKPLFYWVSPRELVFGSELKALMLHSNIPRQVDFMALDNYLSLEYIPGPNTIFQGVKKVPPGHFLLYEEGDLKLEEYWEVPFEPITENGETLVEKLAALIEEAVRIQLVSDVPLGAFLSGGIDSSSVVGFMSKFSTEPVQTFSIGFEDDSYNELHYAQAVADHFHTDHHDQVLKSDLSSLAEKLINHLDEPFADTSIFPTYLVSQLASQSVKVVLSGDGGDELFAGYDTYIAEQLSRYYQWLPVSLRRKTFPAIANWLPPQNAKKGFINKTKRVIEGGALNPSLRHARWMIFINNAEKDKLYQPDMKAALNDYTTELVFEDYFERASQFNSLAQQQYVDMKTYLVDDILTKVDRMSMAASLEVRVPLLDHRLVEFALNLPPHLKINHSRTKIILRRAMKDFVPDMVLTKPKQGFSIPMKHWLKSSLKPLMLDLLFSDCVRHRGYFNPDTISKWVQEHLRGKANHSHRLWTLMVFELWYQKFMGT